MFGHTLSTHFYINMRGLCSLIQFSFPLFILWKIHHSSPLRCSVQTGHPALSMDTTQVRHVADCLTLSYHLRDSLVFQYILLDVSTSMDATWFSFFALLCVCETNNTSRRRFLSRFLIVVLLSSLHKHTAFNYLPSSYLLTMF